MIPRIKQEDKDPNKSKPKVDLKVNPEAKDHSISSYLLAKHKRRKIKDLLCLEAKRQFLIF